MIPCVPPDGPGEDDFADRWSLDPSVSHLNHGSFGACPRPVLAFQASVRERLESNPMRFFTRELAAELADARTDLARFVGAAPESLAFVANATTGVNAVLRSLSFSPGDELLTTNHAYEACAHALVFVCEKHGAVPVVADVPLPIASSGDVTQAILDRVTPRTRLALIDHVTSPTGIVFPIAEIVRELAARGIDTLVDGAHAPGMLALDVGAIGAAYYVGNCHKWLCSPKTAGFLAVRDDRRAAVRPTVIGHGSVAPEAKRFHAEFDWPGTFDPSAMLAVPESIRFLGGLMEGGWDELRARNRALALHARALLCDTLEVDPLCPDAMIGTLAAVPLPGGAGDAPRPGFASDPLQVRLAETHRIEASVRAWPAWPIRLLRVSAAAYNRPAEYERLASVLRAEREPVAT